MRMAPISFPKIDNKTTQTKTGNFNNKAYKEI